MKKLLAFFVASFFILTSTGFAEELLEMDLESLLDTTVTSVTNREQKFFDIPLAMTVITKEDIQRSGARQLPDLFIGVPGMIVNKINDHQYSVAVRGAATQFTNNLLVLLDGVVVYTPLFSGTFWELVPVSLNEIERIEIIRGSGGTFYGANAVNGVINIITKNAKDSQEEYTYFKTGSRNYLESGFGGGTKIGDDAYLRYWGKYEEDDGLHETYVLGTGITNAADQMDHREAFGFKLNKDIDEMSKITLLGAHTEYRGEHTLFTGTACMEMNTLLANYERKVSETYDYNIQLSWAGNRVRPDHNAYQQSTDITMQNTVKNTVFTLPSTLTFGLGYRYNSMNESDLLKKTNDNYNHIPSAFVHDEIKLTDKLTYNIGLRAWDESMLQTEDVPLFSPHTSFVYQPSDKHSYTFAYTHTYRTPGFIDYEGNCIVGAVRYLATDGTAEPERVENFNLGYKGSYLDDKLTVDANAFYSELHDMASLHSDSAVAPFTLGIRDGGTVITEGVELDLNYRLASWLELYTDHTFMDNDVHRYTPVNTFSIGGDYFIRNQESSLSSYQGGFGTRVTHKGWKFDLYAKYIDGYTFIYFNEATLEVTSYWKMRSRIAYEFELKNGTKIELELVGDNLVGGANIEDSNGGLVDEFVYGGVKITF
ncbi:TonB-dependent receptor plug domain-containing protein [bacterium]|nr:TonB-dependent receptor plug domain-containing protein [bacterium]